MSKREVNSFFGFFVCLFVSVSIIKWGLKKLYGLCNYVYLLDSRIKKREIFFLFEDICSC